MSKNTCKHCGTVYSQDKTTCPACGKGEQPTRYIPLPVVIAIVVLDVAILIGVIIWLVMAGIIG